MLNQYLERVVDLLDPTLNRIHNMTAAEAQARLLRAEPERRPRDRRFLCPDRPRGQDGSPGPFVGPADAVFPGETG